MSKLDWTLACVIAGLAAGCAGKLDPHEDYFGDRTSGAIKTSAAGSGERSAAGSGSRWQDAGASDSSAQAGASAPKNDASMSAAGSRAPAQPAWGSDDDYDAGSSKAADPPAAGSGGAAKPDAGAASMAAACDFKGIVQTKCGNPNCHGAPASNTGLDLTSAGLAMRLDGRKGASACTDKLLIDKDHPEASMLYLKVTGSDCGVKMPLGGSLTASEQACFLTWIEGL